MALGPIRLARLQQAFAAVDPQGRFTSATLRVLNDIIGQIESAFASIAQNITDIGTAQAAAEQAGTDAATAQGAAEAALTEAQGKQPLDATLTALAGLNATPGLVEQTGTDTFAKRVIGVGAANSIPTRGDADTRYVLQDVGLAWDAPTGAVSRATFDTATVTTADLAQRVAAIIADLKANGALK